MVRMVVLTANFLLFPFVLLVEHLFSPMGASPVLTCRSMKGALPKPSPARCAPLRPPKT